MNVIKRISIFHDLSTSLFAIAVYELLMAAEFIPKHGENIIVALGMLILGYICMGLAANIHARRGIDL